MAYRFVSAILLVAVVGASPSVSLPGISGGAGTCTGKTATLDCAPSIVGVTCQDLSKYVSTEDPCEKHDKNGGQLQD